MHGAVTAAPPKVGALADDLTARLLHAQRFAKLVGSKCWTIGKCSDDEKATNHAVDSDVVAGASHTVTDIGLLAYVFGIRRTT